MKELRLKVLFCNECPWLEKDANRHVNGESFPSCVYGTVLGVNAPSVGTMVWRDGDRNLPIPDWCPLPDVETPRVDDSLRCEGCDFRRKHEGIVAPRFKDFGDYCVFMKQYGDRTLVNMLHHAHGWDYDPETKLFSGRGLLFTLEFAKAVVCRYGWSVEKVVELATEDIKNKAEGK